MAKAMPFQSSEFFRSLFRPRTSAMLKLRVLLGAIVIAGGRDGDRKGDGRLQAEVDEGFRRDHRLLAARSGIHAGTRGAPGQAADHRALAAPGQRSNDGAQCRTAARFLRGVLASRGALLAERIGYERDLFPTRREVRQLKTQKGVALEVSRLPGIDNAPHYRRSMGNGDHTLGAEIARQGTVEYIISLCGFAVERFRNPDGDNGSRRQRDFLDHRLGRRRRGRRRLGRRRRRGLRYLLLRFRGRGGGWLLVASPILVAAVRLVLHG